MPILSTPPNLQQRIKILLKTLEGNDFDTLIKDVDEWNEKLEEVVRVQPSSLFPTNESSDEENDVEIEAEKLSDDVSQVSNFLHFHLMSLLILLFSNGDERETKELNECQRLDNDSIVQLADTKAYDMAKKLTQWFSSSKHDQTEEGNVGHICVLVRTIKNVLRLMHHYVMLQRHNKVLLQQKYQRNPPLQKLKSKGMTALYLNLLHEFSGTKTFKTSSNLARFASHALFHSTYGSSDAMSQKARSYFINSLNGIPILMKVILYPNDISLMASLAKLIHNMLGTNMSLHSKMNSALKRIVDEHWNPTIFTRSVDIKEEYNLVDDLVADTACSFPLDTIEAVFVSTLASLIRDNELDPPFQQASITDLRPELALEILNILFVIQSIYKKESKDENEAIMTQIGIVVTDILHIPSQNPRVYKVKLAVVNLLLDAPDPYGQYLYNNEALVQLWNILEIQLNKVVINDTSHGKSSDAAIILPILIVWKKFAQSNPLILNFFHEKIFPSESDSAATDNVNNNTTSSAIDNNDSSSNMKSKKNKLAPSDAPRGTIRYKLIKLMTWLESNVKRAASELLWVVCGEDPKVFIEKTGFGNAVHLLGIKGLLNLPTGSN